MDHGSSNFPHNPFQGSHPAGPLHGLSGTEAATLAGVIQGLYQLLGNHHCSCCRHHSGGLSPGGTSGHAFPGSHWQSEGRNDDLGSGFAQSSPASQSYHNRHGFGPHQGSTRGLPDGFRTFCSTSPKSHLVSECSRLGLPPPSFVYTEGGGGVGSWQTSVRVPWDSDTYVAGSSSKSASEAEAIKAVFRRYQINYSN